MKKKRMSGVGALLLQCYLLLGGKRQLGASSQPARVDSCIITQQQQKTEEMKGEKIKSLGISSTKTCTMKSFRFQIFLKIWKSKKNVVWFPTK